MAKKPIENATTKGLLAFFRAQPKKPRRWQDGIPAAESDEIVDILIRHVTDEEYLGSYEEIVALMNASNLLSFKMTEHKLRHFVSLARKAVK